MKKLLILLLAVFAFTNTYAGTNWDWEDLEATFNDVTNWTNGIPDCTQAAEVNKDGAVCVVGAGETMTVNALNVGRNVSQPLTYGVPTVKVDGGSLLVEDCTQAAASINVAGFDSSSMTDVPGRLEVINNGYVSCNILTLGKRGPAELYMDSGTIESVGTWFGRYNTQTIMVDLAGGTFYAGDLYWYDSATHGAADININGGQLVLNGDETATMASWVDSGRMYSLYGASIGTVLIDYDSTNDQTVVTSINQPPLVTTNPEPDGSIDAFDPNFGILSWEGTVYTTNYDVYLGTDSASVAAADTTSPEFVANVTTESIDLAGYGITLDTDTTYYWRVDGKDSSSTLEGNVWGFTVVDYAFMSNWNSYGDLTEMQADGWTFDSANMAIAQTGAGNNYLEYCIDTLGSETLTKTYSSSTDLTNNGDFVNFVLRHTSPEPLSVDLTLKDSTAASETVTMGTTGASSWTDLWVNFSDFSSVDPTDVVEFTLTFTSDSQATCIDIAGLIAFPVTCFEEPASDLTGDCKVDFADLSILTSEWLKDGF